MLGASLSLLGSSPFLLSFESLAPTFVWVGRAHCTLAGDLMIPAALLLLASVLSLPPVTPSPTAEGVWVAVAAPLHSRAQSSTDLTGKPAPQGCSEADLGPRPGRSRFSESRAGPKLSHSPMLPGGLFHHRQHHQHQSADKIL